VIRLANFGKRLKKLRVHPLIGRTLVEEVRHHS
jgi:hypothetical protein